MRRVFSLWLMYNYVKGTCGRVWEPEGAWRPPGVTAAQLWFLRFRPQPSRAVTCLAGDFYSIRCMLLCGYSIGCKKFNAALVKRIRMRIR